MRDIIDALTMLMNKPQKVTVQKKCMADGSGSKVVLSVFPAIGEPKSFAFSRNDYDTLKALYKIDSPHGTLL